MSVIHHYSVPNYPKVMEVRVPFGSRIVSTKWRAAAQSPAIYVEKPEAEGEEAVIAAFFVATGQPFQLAARPVSFSFVGTVDVGGLFFHVYAMMFYPDAAG